MSILQSAPAFNGPVSTEIVSAKEGVFVYSKTPSAASGKTQPEMVNVAWLAVYLAEHGTRIKKKYVMR